MQTNTESRGFVNIILASRVDAGAIDALGVDHEIELAVDDFGPHRAEALKDQEVLVFRSGVDITSEIMDLAPKLVLIVRAGSGFDNVDLNHARRRGIRVVRIPGPSADAVAEFTFGLIIALSRQIVRADALVRNGLWPKPQLAGTLLGDKVLGVSGAGNSGTRVGALGAAWGMQVLGCVDPAEEPWQPPPFMQASALGTVLRRADVITLHTPLTEATRHLISTPELAVMKRGTYLISTGRGGVVDEVALYDALTSGHLAGAALDVHEREGDGVIPKLAELPNVVLTPHIAGMAIESQRAIGRRVVELINAHNEGRLDTEVTVSELLV